MAIWSMTAPKLSGSSFHAAAFGRWTNGLQRHVGEYGYGFAVSLAAVGAIAAVALNRWGFDKDSRRFFAALTLGILGRLLLYGAALVYVALRTRIDVTATAASLLGFYVLFQIVEIRLALRGLKTKS